jgi:hypothetical protein
MTWYPDDRRRADERPDDDGLDKGFNAEVVEDAPWDSGPLPYQVICYAALGVIYFVESRRGATIADLLIPAVGVLGVLSRWGLAPLIVLLLLGAVRFLKAATGQVMGDAVGPGGIDVRDVLLCMAVLAYTGAQYRLQGLMGHVLPPDPRRRRAPRDRARDRTAPQPRSPQLASRVEVGAFLLSLPVWALMAQLVWIFLSRHWDFVYWPQARRFGRPPDASDWSERLNRLIVFAWALGILLFVTATLLKHWKHRQLTSREAALFLQDVAWKELRGDQRRITRWLAWGRLKKRRENP